MTESPVDAAGTVVTYAYRPSVMGAVREFRLSDDGIDWAAGVKSGHIPYRNIFLVRMSYRPTTMQSHRFVTELWAEGAPKLQIVSSSWKSMAEQERLDQILFGLRPGITPSYFECGDVRALQARQSSVDLLAKLGRFRRGRARACRIDRAGAANRRLRWRGIRRRLPCAISLAGRKFPSTQSTGRILPGALPKEVMPAQ